MRTIVHLSDLHFGNHFPYLLEPVLQAVERIAPDLVVISGDLAEHATHDEFVQARSYLDRLPRPQLVVPGNHDLAFYNPVRRIAQNIRGYRKSISHELFPTFIDSEMAVVGINTPRIFPMKNGRISLRQVERIQQATCALPKTMARILVTHHPLDLPEQFHKDELVWRARRAVKALSPCIDLLLAGHLHLSSTGATAARYRSTGHSVIFAQAGTATSMRNKGEPNSFNVIRIAPEEIEIQRHIWQADSACFDARAWERFTHSSEGWCKNLADEQSEQIQLS